MVSNILAQGTAEDYLICSPDNVRYVTGFSGHDSQVLVTARGAQLFTDSRYAEQAKKDVGPDVAVQVTTREERYPAIRDALYADRPVLLGIEEDYITVADFGRLKNELGVHSFVDISEMLLELRSVKTQQEIDLIATACRATEEVLEAVLPHIGTGVSEFDIRARLYYEMSIRGMDSAFEPIVAGGPNSAIPHATTTSYKLQEGDMLTLDFGCRFQGYCSDITRTFAIGRVDAKLKTIYDIVEQAQKRALDTAEIGISAAKVDSAARRFIQKKGYAENFGHATGHGVGLQIHELPLISAASKAVIAEGNVFTIEPGIYVEGLGGVRIEDTCVAGIGSLYTFPKDLIVL